MEGLFVKYLKGEMTRQESGEFLRKVKSDNELRNKFSRFQNVYSITGLKSKGDDIASGKKKYELFIRKKRQKSAIQFFLKVLSTTALIAIIIVALWASISNHDKSKLLSSIFKNTVSVNAPPGQRSMITLSDNTVVWLNSKSQLIYPSVFSTERNVQLTGEALFEVSTNPDKPFVVTVGELRITALGTKFNVLAYPENDFIQVSLLKGKIIVSDLKSGREIIPDANQQVYSKNGLMQLSDVSNPDYFLWKDGIYSFVDEPFSEIIKKLENYYDVKIVVQNPSILNVIYTGKFRQQDGVDLILNMLRKIHLFKITKEDYVFYIK
jgi:ferric-dicitrate binding protein FerR (iron transport regulator)